MLTFRRNTLALLVLLSLPVDATDYTVEYGGGPPPKPIYGELTDNQFLGDPTFHRPWINNGTGVCTGQVFSEDYRYDTITLTNTGNSEADVDLEIDTGFCDAYHDSVVYGYSGVFTPDEPVANCFIVNGDVTYRQNRCSRLSTTLVPDQRVVFVVASQYPYDTWPWTATFNDHLFDDGLECLSEVDSNCSVFPWP